MIIVIVALVLSSLAYGFSRYDYSDKLFEKVQSMFFKLEMSEREVRSYLDKFKLVSRMETVKEDSIATILKFETGEEFDETLTLYFLEDKLTGFDYDNFGLTLEIIGLDLDF